MPESSTHLALPYLQPSQAQKHVTHNEALRRLDAIVQLAVADRTRTTAPAGASEGDRHIVAAGATGAWAGQGGRIAMFADGAWMFFAPEPGWRAEVLAEAQAVVFDGTVWSVPAAPAPSLQNLPGIGVATTSDATNRLAVSADATLLSHDGAGHQLKLNKAGAAQTASLLWQTGFSGRAEIGTAGNDDLSVKVSANGSAWSEALRIERGSGRVRVSEPILLASQEALPALPPVGFVGVFSRTRAGAGWVDVLRPSGRDFPLQPHTGVNRVATWAPSSGAAVVATGMPRTSVGTVAHPTLTATSLATSSRRWRVTSAATADSVADERSAVWTCWRGNAAGLGGFTYVQRLSLTTLQATGAAFFGLMGSTAALATTQTLVLMLNCIGIGFQRGTHTNWQMVHNAGSGNATRVDLGSDFALSTADLLTLYIHAAPNDGSVWLRLVNDSSGTVTDREITTNLPANTQFLAPRNYMNNGSTAAAVAYDSAGLYLETDY